MINFTSNINDVLGDITAGLNEISNPETVLKSVAQTMVTVVSDRIHDKGQDANGSQIGEYSNSYMNVRTGNYKNKPRPGVDRPVYNRTNDKKVVLSLTRQMENDFGVVETPDGYGLGFKNIENYKKSQYAEKTYNKIIYDLTPPEKEMVIEVADFEVNRLLNND